jgi:molecular chaperone DnaK (HSP70)
MKLDFESIGAWFSAYKKPLVIGVLLLIALGGTLFLLDRISGWWSGRKIDQARANVNAATQELKDAQANVAKEKQAEAVALEKVKIETNTYLEAVNASDDARTQTNQAIQNMQSAINANRDVNITADQLDQKLKELDY